MAPSTTSAPVPPPARRPLQLIPGGRRLTQRDQAVSRARDARRRLDARQERFAHLRRQYD